MSETDPTWLSATEQAALIRRRKISPLEIVDALLTRIDKINPRLNAYVLINADQSRRDAKAAERALGKRGVKLGPLHGVPFGVKDLVVTKHVRTTFGTPLFRDNVPTEDAPMVERLKAAGAIMIGKTNTPTFGWIGATHNLVFGPTRNPPLAPGAVPAAAGPRGWRLPSARCTSAGTAADPSASPPRARESTASSHRMGASRCIRRAARGACRTSAR